MSSVPIESTMPENCGISRRFGDLRGVQWRLDLGILPSSSSIDHLRRVTANSRRRYAALRRQLLVDPHVPKDGSNSPDLIMDNPLSQSPDSMWGRFFRNAELERMLDQDLTRLYPERGSYFQTSECQAMLRRVLLLWCLSHPEYGYRQGMHELLAPLLYVLHVDVERLSEVRKVHEDHFADKFDGFSFHENDLTYKFDFKKFSESLESENGFQKSPAKASSLNDLDPEIQTIVLLSDAYGAEGELGIVLSDKFMEHDAYSMFDALMNGAGGAVSMAEFFSPSPFGNSHTGFAPVIEASAAFYHLLSIVESSLHTHLVELGVEPQYFSLRWLRVLFGREFSLEDLLVIWDEIFAHDNTKSKKPVTNDPDSNSGVLDSERGAFISAFAVSMILSLRSSLLATENATSCLQRLLNFPDDVNLMKLIEKAKSLQSLALESNNSNSLLIHSSLYDGKKSVINRGHSLPIDSTSPRTPLKTVPESYWEEKWRVLHKEQEEQVPSIRKRWSERVKLRLSRTESDPSPSNKNEITKTPKPSVRRSLLEDLERSLGSDEDKDTAHHDPIEVNEQDVADEKVGEENSPKILDTKSPVRGNKEENSPKFLDRQSPARGNNEGNSPKFLESKSSFRGNSEDHENDPESSSVASNSSIDGNDAESSGTNQECSPLPVSDPPDGPSLNYTQNDDSVGKFAKGLKEKKILSGKFQWLWKFGRNGNEGTSDRSGAAEDAKACNGESGEKIVDGFKTVDACDSSCGTSKGEMDNQDLMVSLRDLGQSMLENIQVIESVFQQDRGKIGPSENFSKNGLVGEGQVTALTALKELRKISNILSEM
ncbi:hypothetical protein BUALT_Bualt11G0080600 [Buddleja alternifolia]|uniref:Rab-GAP TBC domain-containing protein n=1 Tax=Buddleja alternifolia TaxID=168488 RepID=A0AAV6WZS0_9LAMI|nr:hypothetical protein BUALT_Bualt11G0080600 [Buddleja alternifolia]